MSASGEEKKEKGGKGRKEEEGLGGAFRLYAAKKYRWDRGDIEPGGRKKKPSGKERPRKESIQPFEKGARLPENAS